METWLRGASIRRSWRWRRMSTVLHVGLLVQLMVLVSLRAQELIKVSHLHFLVSTSFLSHFYLF